VVKRQQNPSRNCCFSEGDKKRAPERAPFKHTVAISENVWTLPKLSGDQHTDDHYHRKAEVNSSYHQASRKCWYDVVVHTKPGKK
jgi:hypothetical protein